MVSIICKSSFLSGQYTGSSSVFFANQNFSREIERPSSYENGFSNHSSTSSEISFHGLPSKSKHPSIRTQKASPLSSQLIVLLFLRNSHLQRDILQTFFRQYFCEKFLQCIKNTFRKFL